MFDSDGDFEFSLAFFQAHEPVMPLAAGYREGSIGVEHLNQ